MYNYIFQDVVRLLLENGANVDIKNNFKCAPINLAIEALQRKVCHVSSYCTHFWIQLFIANTILVYSCQYPSCLVGFSQHSCIFRDHIRIYVCSKYLTQIPVYFAYYDHMHAYYLIINNENIK